MRLRYLINGKREFEALCEYLESEEIWAYDTETNGSFQRSTVSLVGISFGFDTFACYVPVLHEHGLQLDINYVLERLKPIFENPKNRYVAHNAKFDEMVLKIYGIECKGIGDDTYVLSWLFSETKESKGLKPLTERYLGVQMQTYEDVINSIRRKRGQKHDLNFARVTLNNALQYAADDAYYTLQLFHIFNERLTKEKLEKAYQYIERPFNRVLRHIEDRGVHIDREYLEWADKELPFIAKKVEAEIYKEAGEVFNIGSPAQLGKILFEKLAIGKNVPRTATGNYSTNKKTLSTYQGTHNIVDNILRRKKISKTHSTFIEGIKPHIEKDGKVHPSFNGCGTVSGRLSCRDPNLQQIEGDEVEEVKVRNFFIPSKGYTFIVSDYGQIELRIMAHFSKDEAMINGLTGGRDFHTEVTKKIFGDKYEEGNRRQRLVAKTLNFGVGFGRGPNSIAEQLVISEQDARKFISDWFAQFPGVARYKSWLIKRARADGYIRTLSGRKRRLLPEIRSDDWRIRGGAERQAFNTKIQGSASDIIKAAMISLEPKLEELGCFMLIQVHDELVFEVPEEKTNDAVVAIKHTMEHPLNGKNPLVLPLVTEPKIVERWSDAK